MQLIPIASVPNQSFSVELDGSLYDLALTAANGCMAVSIGSNGNAIISGMRAVSGSLIIPYDYLNSGNFLFLTLNEDQPDYTKFNVSQVLIYVSAADIASMQVDGLYLSSLGDLPLRLVPPEFNIYLLTESGDYLTTESGERILLDQSNG